MDDQNRVTVKLQKLRVEIGTRTMRSSFGTETFLTRSEFLSDRDQSPRSIIGFEERPFDSLR
jgi:hypothetical protein